MHTPTVAMEFAWLFNYNSICVILQSSIIQQS